MKLFNPFTAHIATLNSLGYAVRRLHSSGWTYLDRIEDYWWVGAQSYIHFCFETPAEAYKRLLKFNSQPKSFSTYYED